MPSHVLGFAASQLTLRALASQQSTALRLGVIQAFRGCVYVIINLTAAFVWPGLKLHLTDSPSVR